MKSHLTLIIIFTSFLSQTLKAQNVTITPSGITRASSSSYQRLSYEAIAALPSPQEGDIAYDLTFHCMRVYNGNKWICLSQNPESNLDATVSDYGDTESDGGVSVKFDATGNMYLYG